MGSNHSQFTDDELSEYEALTYFSKSEILRAHDKFKKLAPEKVGHNKNAKLSLSKLLQYPELKVNPFGDRICQIFSRSKDGNCTFDDFIDILSVFNNKSPKILKYEYIFRIFDFDDDDALNESDIRHVINRLISPNEFSEREMQQLIKNIFNEADLDNDEAISFLEFECILTKFPDFSSIFHINL